MNKFKIFLYLLPFATLIIVAGCTSDAPFKFEGTTIPEQLNDGWEVASPEAVDLNQETLDKVYANFVAEDKYSNAKSLLVVKNGKLIFEAYCRTPKDRDRIGHVQSVTKSVTSLLFGIVKSEGYIQSLDQTLYSIIPDKFSSGSAKQAITLHQLLTMTSGIEFDNDVFSVEIYCDQPADPVKYILNKPMYAGPGEKFYYRDADPHLISYVIKRSTGRTLAQWADEKLFGPLGINDYYWDSDHTGLSMGGHGLHLKPRDMAKIGQLVLNHGQWDDIQFVDSTWIAISTQKQVDSKFNSDPHNYDYGYYWWILPNRQAVTAWGAGGNYIFIVPTMELVIVMTSMPDVDNGVLNTGLPAFENLINPILADY